MPREDQRYETAKWRTFWLMVGFALLVGIGIATVLRPELENEHGDEAATETDAVEEPGTDGPLQE